MAGAISVKRSNSIDTTVVRRKVLGVEHNFILGNLVFDTVHDEMIRMQMFDDITLADLKEELKTSNKIRCLLELLKKCSEEDYAMFKEALKNTKQGHIEKRLVMREKKVIQEAVMEAGHRKLRVKQTAYSSQEALSKPQDIPRSPIAQPTPSFNGSPGMHDVHGSGGERTS